MTIYLILLALGATIFWMYYRLCLKSNTHFKLIRFYFLFAMISALLTPFMDQFQLYNIQMEESIQENVTVTVNELVLNKVADLKSDIRSHQSTERSSIQWVLLIYIVGCSFFLMRAITASLSIIKLQRQSLKRKVKGTSVYFSNKINHPFSVFRSIYLPKHWEGKVPQEVIDHEFIHIQEQHFIDLLIAELISNLLWFYPVSYFLKKDVRTNLEYLADQAVINKGQSICHYQSLLLSVATGEDFKAPITMYFNVPLKNRITMMTKRKAGLKGKLAVLGGLPIIAVLVAFNVNKESKEPIEKIIEPIVVFVEDENKPTVLPLDKVERLKVTSEYGMAMHPILKVEKMHNGIDLRADIGSPVYATSDGTIEFAKYDANHGYYVQIKHSEKYQSRYSHLQNFIVKENDFVKAGQIIGYSGSTGQSTGPHLHFEIKVNGEFVNPRSVLKALDDC